MSLFFIPCLNFPAYKKVSHPFPKNFYSLFLSVEIMVEPTISFVRWAKEYEPNCFFYMQVTFPDGTKQGKSIRTLQEYRTIERSIGEIVEGKQLHYCYLKNMDSAWEHYTKFYTGPKPKNGEFKPETISFSTHTDKFLIIRAGPPLGETTRDSRWHQYCLPYEEGEQLLNITASKTVEDLWHKNIETLVYNDNLVGIRVSPDMN